MDVIVGEDKVIKLECQTGVTDVVLEVYRDSTLVFTAPMVETLNGLYQVSFTNVNVENLTGSISSIQLNQNIYFDINVIEDNFNSLKNHVTAMNFAS